MKPVVALGMAAILAFGIWAAVATNAGSNERIQQSRVDAAEAKIEAINNANAAQAWSK